MAKPSAKRHQKALQRKAAKRKQKRASSKPRLTGRALLRAAGRWPLHECLLTKEWQEEGAITQILVARRSPSGQIAVGVFLVDLGCLGVKSAFGRPLHTMQEYRELRDGMKANQDMIKADINLVAKIIREAIAYAGELGFKPDPDYRDAMLVLGDADPDACEVPIPLGGKDGKPFFVAGPYDNADRIMAKLTRKLGPDGFHYLVPLSGDEEFFLEEFE
ncbi:MAG: hypothetical protein E3J21_18435 [Anaerolineales bacterium]|nr:MAG: hypothetical protein E3J21_18435 [Anaerolineales bacterium]